MLLDYVVFFKQKTAYDFRIRDWSSDVCSSDLVVPRISAARAAVAQRHVAVIAEIGYRGGDAEIGDPHPGGRTGEARSHPGGVVDVEVARGDAFVDDQHDVAPVGSRIRRDRKSVV